MKLRARTLARHAQKPPEPADAPRIIVYRPWQAGDSPEAVTQLLHQSFARLVRMGIPCASGLQPSSQTLTRLQRGASFVAVDADRIVGTISVYAATPASECPLYRDGAVASIHQFAVDPAYQGAGIGDALLRMAECRAKEDGFKFIALDTPGDARHLHRYYLHKGFEFVSMLRFKGRQYASVVLRKALADDTGVVPPLAWI